MDGNSEMPPTSTTCDDHRGRGGLSATGRVTSTLLKKIRSCVQNVKSRLWQASETPTTLSKLLKARVHLGNMTSDTNHDRRATEANSDPRKSLSLRAHAMWIKAASAHVELKAGQCGHQLIWDLEVGVQFYARFMKLRQLPEYSLHPASVFSSAEGNLGFPQRASPALIILPNGS